MDIKKIKAIISLVKESGIAELEVTEGDDKLRISALVSSVAPSPTQYHTITPPATNINVPTIAPSSDVINRNSTSPQETSPINDQNSIKSPMVGTFYRSSSPSTPPFIEVGQTVEVGQIVCIIEAMKLMNQIESSMAGTIVEVLVKDGAPVEFGQALFKVE